MAGSENVRIGCWSPASYLPGVVRAYRPSITLARLTEDAGNRIVRGSIGCIDLDDTFQPCDIDISFLGFCAGIGRVVDKDVA